MSDGSAAQEKNQIIDPVTYEVIRHKLWSINEEGSATMIHVSGSPVVHATDYNFGIYTADGEMAVIGVYLLTPLYTGTMAIKEILRRFETIESGDVFVINDPYLAAIHQNDVQVLAPYFHDGELVAWTGSMAHQVDLGGMDAGSWCPSATDVYQEALLIPPLKLVSAGRRNQELWDIIVANSRIPFVVSTDLTAFEAAHRVAHDRLAELCNRYGSGQVVGTMNQYVTGSEDKLRGLLEGLPDGVFEHEGFLDAAGANPALHRIRCKLTKEGDELTFDFNGSAPQSSGYGNATLAGTLGAISTAIFCTFGSEVEWNYGLMRPVNVIADEGMIVSAVSPAPVSGGAAGANWIAMNCAVACIAKMLSFSDTHESLVFGPGDGSWPLAQFGGTNQYGEPFAAMYMDSLLWGGPAFSFRDGVDSGGAMVILGGGTQDVEQQELLQPLMYLWRREVADSGGAGRFRGGNGIEYAMTPIDSDEVVGTLATHGVALPTRTGIFGGYPGSCSRYEVVRSSDCNERLRRGEPVQRLDQLGGQHEELSSVSSSVPVRVGDVVNISVDNGGGYGDPLTREPERVLQDILDGAVTPDAAEKLYGVVITEDRLDAEATAQKHQEIRSGRLQSMTPPESGKRVEPSGEEHLPGESWGPSLRFERSDGAVVVHCGHCGENLGHLSGRWHGLAGTLELAATDLGPLRQMREELHARQYICPECAASLWVEVEPQTGETWQDFAI